MVVFGLATRALSCTYDLLGDNIETISEGGVQRQKYYYDSLNQLIREDNLDLNKTIVYSYDLGGNLTSTKEYAYQTGATVAGTTESATVLARNPYLYRGYRYDSETGLYYLNSRYYDPETGRFINADGLINQGFPFGNNLFVYCGNNPVKKMILAVIQIEMHFALMKTSGMEACCL